jgi:flagellar hook-associated protein 1 FlgK
MPNLVSLLGTASNALSAFSAQQQTASHNMANASTAGYSRQRVELQTQHPEYLMGSWIGRGVVIGGVTQARDAFLERQIPGALGSSARFAAESEALQSVGALDPEAAGSLTDALAKFYSDLRALAQSPGDAGARSALIGAARAVTQAFKRASTALEESRSGLDAKLEANVAEINDLTAKMASLNKQIAQAQATGSRPNDLLDERLRVRDRLAELTGAVPVPDERGNLAMVLPSGLALVSGGEAATLSVVADVTNGGHLNVRVQRVGAAQPDPFFSATAFGGEVRGIVDARDGALKTALDSLDTLAFDWGTAFNAQHRAGFALDGSAGLDFFTLPGAAGGAAATIDLDAAIAGNPRLIAAASAATSVPGDAGNLHLLVATERTALSTGADVSGTLASIISSFASASRTATAMAEQDGAIAQHLHGLREAHSGVSLDEEIVAMTQAQRAYEAMGKIIQVTDQMLDVLMKLR